MTVLIGVDGGGSKTSAVVVDERGHVLGMGEAGGGNHQINGVDASLANIRAAVMGALRAARCASDDVAFVEYGLAGADRDRDFNLLRPALASLPFADWDLVCDTHTGLRIGSRDGTGVVLVCGAGTNAMGRDGEGQTVRVGGFGYRYGDGAGGDVLAAATFRSAVRSSDGRDEPSMLPLRVAQFLGCQSMQEALDQALDAPHEPVPLGLSLVVHEAAAAGDALAIRLLRSMGAELGAAALAVVRQLGGFGGASFPVVLVGSILQRGRSPHVLGPLEETVRGAYSRAQFVIPKLPPVFGAALLAMDRLGVVTGDEQMENFTRAGEGSSDEG